MLKSPLVRQIAQISLVGLGFGSLAAIVYLAGPLLSIGGWRPLENPIVRDIAVVAIGALGAAVISWQIYRRKQATEEIAKGIAGEDKKDENDAPVLQERMKDALTTLKGASGGKADFLYELPWYMWIGPPGAGKTTALVNAGLKFPLARGATPEAIAGVGGTRYCDWWFTEEAVLIDTAGRYTTQDSDAKADQQSWLAFLDLLKRNRPRQPINGVLVAISLEDLLTKSSAQIAADANAIRTRLLEVHSRLKVDFPVYAIFTKADLVAGFREFFSNLGEDGRRVVWGATFQTADKTRNMIGEVPAEFDLLLERLNQDLMDRLQEEATPSNRVSLFGFPAQMAALKRPIFEFLNLIFEPTRYHANATLRGFYFTSGTQERTPIDQVIGALAKSFGAEEVAAASYSGRGRSYFLTDLIKTVIIGEAAWVSTDRAAVRRGLIIKSTAIAALTLFSLAAATAWWTSYRHNRALIDRTEAAAQSYQQTAGPTARETIVDDHDFAKVLPLLDRLRNLPAGYVVHNAPTPVPETFGLSQRARLQSSSESAYRVGLERLFRSRLIYRLEKQLEQAAKARNTAFIYGALKVYLMMGGLQAMDRDLVLAWWRRDWAENLYPGAANVEGRKELEAHLVALLDLEGGSEPQIGLHGPLVEECQRQLGRLSVSQRAYELLKGQARTSTAREWVAARQGGPDMARVFEAAGESLEALKVPGFYTYAGFHRDFIAQLAGIAEQIKKERWVLGAIGEQSGVAEQYDRLADDLLELYTRDFVSFWQNVLGKLKLKRLTADKPKYEALSAVAAATSPLRTLLESVRDETAVTRERPGFNKTPDGKPAENKPAEPAVLFKQSDRAPGAAIEAAFKPYHVMLEGDSGGKALDLLIAALADAYQSLTLASTNPAQLPQAMAQLSQQVSKLKAIAARLPAPFADMMRTAANDFENDAAKSSGSVLDKMVREQVTAACETVVTGTYPFVRGSAKDLQLIDFGKVFGPGGAIDRFFAQHLAPLADTSKRDWVWRPDSKTASTLKPGSLRDFQRAAEIRDAFFQTGGAVPGFSMAITPPAAPAGISIKLDINGAAVESKPQGGAPPSPVSVQWPGVTAVGRSAVVVSQDAAPPPPPPPPGAGAPAGAANAATPPPAPSILERQGPWSMFRLLEAGSMQRRGDRTVASFIVGGRELQYVIQAGSVHNPLNLALLRDFKCPSGM